MITQPKVSLPLGHNSEWSLKELRAFETDLSNRRKNNKEFSGSLRSRSAWNTPRMGKLRDEELVPILYLATHLRWPDDSRIRLSPPDKSVDVKVTIQNVVRDFDVTITTMRRSSSAGLELQPMRRYRQMLTSIEKESVEEMNNEELISAATDGLISALEAKQDQRKLTCELVIHAIAYSEWLEPHEFINLARIAWSKAPLKGFRRVYILDKPEGFLVEFSSLN